MLKIVTACGEKHMNILNSNIEYCKNIKYEHLHLWKIGVSKDIMLNEILPTVDNDDLVLFLDADDVINGDIGKALNLAREHDLVYSDCWNVNKMGYKTRFRSHPFDVEEFKRNNFIPYSGVIAKGWLVKKELYPGNFHSEDWRYWAALYKHSQDFFYSGECFVTRRDWTSHRRLNVPVYRKLRRLYMKEQTRKWVIKILES